jgi:hypothetical protein
MLRAKLSGLSLSRFAQKAGDLPSLANPARRIRLARVFHAPAHKFWFPLGEMRFLLRSQTGHRVLLTPVANCARMPPPR